MIPKPRFLQKTIREVGIGTFQNVATVLQTATVYDALSVFVERRVSALPVVDEQGTPTHPPLLRDTPNNNIRDIVHI